MSVKKEGRKEGKKERRKEMKEEKKEGRKRLMGLADFSYIFIDGYSTIGRQHHMYIYIILYIIYI